MNPHMSQDPLYLLLRDEKVGEFNKLKAQGKTCDFKDCDFRSLDLREMDVKDSDFSGAYFRGSDLRGIDFRSCQLNGASFAQAKVSGCFFPEGVSAQEIIMSLEHGTRIRQPKSK